MIDLNRLFPEGYTSQGALQMLTLASPYFQEGNPGVNSEIGKALGVFEFPDGDMVPVFECETLEALSRQSRRTQYEAAVRITNKGLSAGFTSALFFFFDPSGAFKLSLISATYDGNQRLWNNPKRQSFSFLPQRPNKTFAKRFKRASVTSVNDLAEVFSIMQVTADFYKEFQDEFDALIDALVSSNPAHKREKLSDVALLLVIRTIFLGFIQEKRWLGQDGRFLQESLKRFMRGGVGNFYSDFLRILFLEALNTPRGTSFSGKANLDDEDYLEKGLTASPYLNGGLYRLKPGYDDLDIDFPNKGLERFFDFIFSYEFTVEENSPRDEDLQLNPEFLGIIFERIINKEDGAVYTPRTEVDLMTRLGILEWVKGQTEADSNQLVNLIFEDNRNSSEGSISPEDANELLEKLKTIRILDPAVGSGAFLVGMLHTLNSLESELLRISGRIETKTSFERQKEIIGSCLVGVEVREWAVWICQLRLWLAIFVDAPDDLKNSTEAILPALDFRVRQGDSLVQSTRPQKPSRMSARPANTKQASLLTKLAKQKADYYLGRAELTNKELQQLEREVRRLLLEDRLEGLAKEKAALESQGTYKLESLFDSESLDDSAETTLKIARVTSRINETRSELEDLDAMSNLVWEIEFADVFQEKNGFDIVIGNPPYIASTKIDDPLKRVPGAEYRELLALSVKAKYADFFIGGKVALGLRSDLYSYFYALSLALLNQSGVHIFICSNTWLDIQAGEWLRKLLIHEHDLLAVIDNSAAKSFERADVNTVITITKSTPKAIGTEVAFMSLQVPFSELESTRVIADQLSPNANTAPKTISAIKARLGPEGDYSDEFLHPEWSWGSEYLRTPSILRKITSAGQEKFSSLDEIAEVSGYVHDNNTGGEFPQTKFIKSVKDSTTVWLDEDSIGVRDFGVSQAASIRRVAQILIPRTFGNDHRILVNKGAVIGKEFYRVFLPDHLVDSVGIALNSTIGILQREVLASAGLGGGALKLAKESTSRFLVPNRRFELPRDSVISFLRRETMPIAIELGFETENWAGEQDLSRVPEDRLALDRALLSQIGLGDEELQELYVATARLVMQRDTKSRS